MLGESVLQHRVVITRDTFENVLAVLAGLKLMADGMYFENGEQQPMNFSIRKMLLENDLYDYGKFVKEAVEYANR